MPNNLLQLLVDVSDAINVARPTAIISSTDQTVRQLLAFANDEVEELAKWDFAELQKLGSVVLADTVDSYAIADDYARFINQTQWDNSTHWPMIGPLSPQQWQQLQSGIVASFPQRRYAVYGYPLKVWINPVPSASDVGRIIAYRYMSKNLILAVDGVTFRERFAADTDICIVNYSALKKGVIWRWLRSKGLPFADQQDEYEEARTTALGQNAGAPALSMARPRPCTADSISPYGADQPAVWQGDNGTWESG